MSNTSKKNHNNAPHGFLNPVGMINSISKKNYKITNENKIITSIPKCDVSHHEHATHKHYNKQYDI